MPHPVKPIKPTEVSLEHTLKGCIHWFQFEKNTNAKTIDDIHPCIIIGKDNTRSVRVIISPITGAKNYVNANYETKYPFHLLLKKQDYAFLDKDSVILLDQVFTIPKESLCEE